MAIFDSISGEYDEWYKTKLGKHVDFVESECAFNLFNITKGMNVLDIGCGTGNFSIKLAKKGCKVTAIDPSKKMLELAREKSARGNLFINYYHMSVYDLKFPDQHFDAVFSMATFEFIKDIARAMDEVFRVCKDKGQIMIGTINRDSKWGQLYSSDEFKKNSVFKDASLMSPEDLKKHKRDHMIKSGECLYIPPDTKEKDINMMRENELSKTEKPGYFCILWAK